MKCPLTTNQYGNRPSCLGGECELTDEAGNCLIKQALQCYINATKAKITTDTERLRDSQFLNTPRIDAYDTPVLGGIKYAHITPTKQYPHGGWFEAPYCDDEKPEVEIY